MKLNQYHIFMLVLISKLRYHIFEVYNGREWYLCDMARRGKKCLERDSCLSTSESHLIFFNNITIIINVIVNMDTAWSSKLSSLSLSIINIMVIMVKINIARRWKKKGLVKKLQNPACWGFLYNCQMFTITIILRTSDWYFRYDITHAEYHRFDLFSLFVFWMRRSWFCHKLFVCFRKKFRPQTDQHQDQQPHVMVFHPQ